MEPNFQNGDYLIIDEITYRFRAPQRGEVIIFRYPLDPKEKYIKRIIGLPGETIEIGEGKVKIYTQKGVFILDESDYLPKSYTPGDLKINLDFNDYFVLGDNRSASLDSRRWGPLPQKYIIGRVFLRAWPLTAIEKFEAPVYQLLK
jgi:signal peptidase I